jgi:GNAT superfamily N-acetyltransferase
VIARRADGYEISDDNDRLEVELIHDWLSTDAFWALGRSLETVRRSIDGSVNFGVYDESGKQVAFARVVTDLATFAWLCDVYVDRVHRGLGIGTWLTATIRDHLAPYQLKRVLLSTKDAHEVYARAGFVKFPDPERLMYMTFTS